MDKQIIINENVTLKFTPDTTVLCLTVEAEDEQYNVAIDLASDYLMEISDTLAEVGMLRDDIKTEGFNVRPKYERICIKDQEFKNVLVGYSCTQTLIMEFGCDAEFLSNIISALSTLDCMPVISLSYKLNNTKEAEEDLIKALSSGAMFKAEALCRSLDARLGKLISVEYMGSGRNYSYRIGTLGAANNARSFAADVEPGEITLSENARFVWEIL